MQNTPEDVSAFRIIEQSVSPDIAAALAEYAGNLEPAERQHFLDYLAYSPDACRQADEALSSMAMLIAGAHVLDDVREFEDLAEKCFAAIFDEPPLIIDIRRFFLENHRDVQMGDISSVPPTTIDRRVARWREHMEALLGDTVAITPE